MWIASLEMKAAFFSLIFSLLALVTELNCQIAHDPRFPRPQPATLIAPLIQPCCGFLAPQTNINPGNSAATLLECANKSLELNNEAVLSRFYASGGPSLGVGIVTFATKDISTYFSYALAVNQAYAEHNGYVFKHFNEDTANFDNNDVRWNKVKILSEAIDPDVGWGRDLDYIIWIDADVIMLDLSNRLEAIASDYPQAQILLSAEHAGSSSLVNSGAVMIRNTEWARSFLKQWWDYGDRRLYSDQEQFDMLYKAKLVPSKQTHRIAVLPPDAINSDPPAMTQQRPNNQVVRIVLLWLFD